MMQVSKDQSRTVSGIQQIRRFEKEVFQIEQGLSILLPVLSLADLHFATVPQMWNMPRATLEHANTLSFFSVTRISTNIIIWNYSR